MPCSGRRGDGDGRRFSGGAIFVALERRTRPPWGLFGIGVIPRAEALGAVGRTEKVLGRGRSRLFVSEQGVDKGRGVTRSVGARVLIPSPTWSVVGRSGLAESCPRRSLDLPTPLVDLDPSFLVLAAIRSGSIQTQPESLGMWEVQPLELGIAENVHLPQTNQTT